MPVKTWTDLENAIKQSDMIGVKNLLQSYKDGKPKLFDSKESFLVHTATCLIEDLMQLWEEHKKLRDGEAEGCYRGRYCYHGYHCMCS